MRQQSKTIHEPGRNMMSFGGSFGSGVFQTQFKYSL